MLVGIRDILVITTPEDRSLSNGCSATQRSGASGCPTPNNRGRKALLRPF
jgi:hypothetical protein